MAENPPSFAQDGLKAIKWLSDYHNGKDADWSRQVKMKAGYVCQRSGVMDKELLDAHHIKPKYQFPELQYELTNGKCLSLLWHAFKHRKDPVICNLILWRAVVILWRRYVGEIPKEIQKWLSK